MSARAWHCRPHCAPSSTPLPATRACRCCKTSEKETARMSVNRRLVLALAAGALAASAQAQSNWPNKTIRMIVPLAAGSAVDNAARIVSEKMGRNLGQSIVIENQPGASGLIGAGNVAKAAPDGYTLGGFNDSIMTMVPNMNPKMPWDILKDFEPVSLVATVEWG